MQLRVNYVSPTCAVFEERIRAEIQREVLTRDRAKAALEALDGITRRLMAEAALAKHAPERFGWTSDGFVFERAEELADKVSLSGEVFWGFDGHRERFVLDVARRFEPFLYSAKFFPLKGTHQCFYIGRDTRGWLLSDE